MTAPAGCLHPEDAREPLPYDGRHPADPDDWRCGECGVTNLRLDRRPYEERLRAAEAERLAEIEMERFAERQEPRFETRTVATREGDVTMAVKLPPMDFRNESVQDVLDNIYAVSGVPPVLMGSATMLDATSMFDSVRKAVVASRETAIQGGFDPARPDSDLTALVYQMHAAGSLVLKRVDRLEFSHDLWHRSMLAIARDQPAPVLSSHGQYRLFGWPVERRDLPPFSFRIVGSP